MGPRLSIKARQTIAFVLRNQGVPYSDIAALLEGRFGVAVGYSQADAYRDAHTILDDAGLDIPPAIALLFGTFHKVPALDLSEPIASLDPDLLLGASHEGGRNG